MDITQDAFLGGQISLKQPQKGYRAGLDAVLLAASIPARPGDRVLDIGCGVGTAALCLNARVAGLSIRGIDTQPVLVRLAQENAPPGNDVAFSCVSLTDEKAMAKNSFDHVLSNPPYFQRQNAIESVDPIKNQANFETMPLQLWVKRSLAYVRPGGILSLIHCAARLDDMIAGADIKRRCLKIIPLWPSAGVPAKRVILQITKDKCAPLIIAPGLVLHEAGRYTPAAQEILKNGGALRC